MKYVQIRPLVALFVALGACGCEQAVQPKARDTYSVEGVVTFEDGQPAHGVLVSFSSLDGSTVAETRTDDAGRYRIDDDQGEGLPVGDYRVVVTPPVAENGDRLPATVAPQYSVKRTSGLTTTIKPRENHYHIQVERPPLIR